VEIMKAYVGGGVTLFVLRFGSR